MKKILQFLATSGSFLYEDRGFRFVDSQYSGVFGGNGLVVLQNDKMDVRLLLDREQLSMDFRGKGRASPRDWFSEDIVRQMITGEIDRTFLDNNNVEFIQSHLDEIEQLFSVENLSTTEAKCRQLQRERSKRLFA